ncbi:MAG: T9SS type A sorting domain-containing protein [Saprospiraceae bacterium]|nr:T9SS type A sorting domain-containing protein [Saprospiraceae bacterium]
MYRGNMEILKAGNKVIFAGGNEPNNFISNKVDVFDLTTNTWSTTKLSQERSDIAAITFEGKAYFAGGYRDDYSVTNRIDIYDGNTDTWSIDSMPLARSAMAVKILRVKFILQVEGKQWFRLFKEVQIYDPAKKQWTTSNLSQERHSLAAVTYKDKIYFAGGRKQGGSSDVIDIYQEVGTSTSNLIESETFIEIYPNPCHQNLNLRFDSNFLQGPYDISILNATTGALYYKNTFNVSNEELKLNIENLSSGLHLLVVSNKNNSITKEFVK